MCPTTCPLAQAESEAPRRLLFFLISLSLPSFYAPARALSAPTMALRPSKDDDDEEALTAASQPLLHVDRRRHLDRSHLFFNCSSQVALVGAKISPIESLDYEIIENDFYKQDWRSMIKIQQYQYVFMKWTLCFLIGLIMSVVGFLNNLAVENIAGMKFVVTSNLMLKGRYGTAFFVFAACNLGLTLFAAIITASMAPTAAGSGIPEVKAYLNGVDAPRIFALKTLFVKIIGSIAAVSGSLLVGKAGPMIHIGASVASLLGQCGSKKHGLTWRWLCYLKNDRDRRDLVTCGAATGITAAFRAPVGGLLFALEEMSSWWRSALLWRAFFTTAVTVVMLRGFIDVCKSGKCGLFGTGGLIMFDMTPDIIVFHLSDVPCVLLVGVVGGILGSLFNFFLERITRVYTLINEKGAVARISLACFISVFTSGLLFGLPWLASCQPCPHDAGDTCPTIGRSGNFKKFQCLPGHYNDLASLIFNTNDDAIRNLYNQDTDTEFHGSTMLIFFGVCFFLSIVSFGIVVPAGLFVPLIVTGASYGRFMGMFVGPHTSLNQGLFAVLGSASLLGGSMRSTVSLCVVILELTNNLYLLPLVMVVLLVSKSVGDAFNKNINNVLMKIKGLPYLEAYAEPYMSQLMVSDVVMGSPNCLHGIEKVRNIVDILKRTNHNGFPVIDERPSGSPVLFGLILRAHLLVLLKKKAFISEAVETGIQAFDQLSSVDFAKVGSGKFVKIEDVQLTDEEMEMFIDLHLFSNSSPFTVVETMSLAKAMILFREVGLRHMLVIPKTMDVLPVVGILTRHDFMAEHIQHIRPAALKNRWKGIKLQLPRFLRCFKL